MDQFRKQVMKQSVMMRSPDVPDEDVSWLCTYVITDFQATFTRDRICSDQFGIGSTMVRIHSAYTGPVRNWNGKVPQWIPFLSEPIWYQMADPIRIGSTRSLVNTRLIRTNFLPTPNGPVPCKRCLSADPWKQFRESNARSCFSE